VPVDARGHPRARVSQDVRDLLQGHPRRGQQARGAVPELVRVPTPEAGLLRDAPKSAAQVRRDLSDPRSRRTKGRPSGRAAARRVTFRTSCAGTSGHTGKGRAAYGPAVLPDLWTTCDLPYSPSEYAS
jgi:hypothetical protein